MLETRCIVLRISPYREADLIVTMLTETHGKISCLARSARKSKHRFFSNLQVFDTGNFIFSKQKGRNYSIDSISNKKSLNLISNRPSNFLLASLFSEIMDGIIPEEDPTFAELMQPFSRVLKNLTKVNDAFEQLSVSSHFLCETAKISGIDPAATRGVFRDDDLSWFKSLSNGLVCRYEPIEASHRAFICLTEFIENSYQIQFRVKKQFPPIWKF